jgi:hypothetical protein
VSRSEKQSGTEPPVSSPVATVLLFALVASLAWAGVAAGPASSGGAAANGVQPDANSVDSESEVVDLDVTRVRTCGDRCRRVTANVTNTGTETLRNVTAETRIYAGDGRFWSRHHRFGNRSANASAERTARIELSLGELFRVVRNDGRVPIETTVRWTGGTATFTERRRVLD